MVSCHWSLDFFFFLAVTLSQTFLVSDSLGSVDNGKVVCRASFSWDVFGFFLRYVL